MNRIAKICILLLLFLGVAVTKVSADNYCVGTSPRTYYQMSTICCNGSDCGCDPDIDPECSCSTACHPTNIYFTCGDFSQSECQNPYDECAQYNHFNCRWNGPTPTDTHVRGIIDGTSNVANTFGLAVPAGYNGHVTGSSPNPQINVTTFSFRVFSYEPNTRYTMTASNLSGYSPSFTKCEIVGGNPVNCSGGTSSTVTIPMDYSPNGGGHIQITWNYTAVPTPTVITNTPTPPLPTVAPGRINMHTTAGQYCSPNLKITWMQLIKDSDGLQKDQLFPNVTLNPNQAYNGLFSNYSCVAGDYYRVRVRYNYPASNPGATDIWDYAIQCPSVEGFSIPCPSPTAPPQPTPANPDPYGENEGGSCTVTGWACDESRSKSPIYVDLYAEHEYFNGGTPLGRTLANQVGKPVAGSGYCQNTTNHGFTFPLPDNNPNLRDGQPHKIYAYAIGIDNNGVLDNHNPALTPDYQTVLCNSPVLTPTPAAWTQLRGTSFQSSSGLVSKIPLVPAPYPGTSVAEPNFILGNGAPVQDAGAVTADGIDLGSNPSAAVSAKKWKNSSYNVSGINISSFVEYLKAKKSYVVVNSLDDIRAQKVNVFVDKAIVINSDADGEKLYGSDKTGPKTPILIILQNSTLTINIAQFNPSNNPIVIIASTGGGDAFGLTGKITFSETTTDANGIFIAETIDTSSIDHGLKITGNLITNSLLNARTWPDNSQPSLFIINDIGTYMKTLPFLSKSTFEWTQLQ